MRRSGALVSRGFKPSACFALPSAPVDGIARKTINACTSAFSDASAPADRDFMTPNAERPTLEAPQTIRGAGHPCTSNHRGVVGVLSDAGRPCSSFSTSSPVAPRVGALAGRHTMRNAGQLAVGEAGDSVGPCGLRGRDRFRPFDVAVVGRAGRLLSLCACVRRAAEGAGLCGGARPGSVRPMGLLVQSVGVGVPVTA